MPNMTEYGVKQALPYSWYRNYFKQNQNLDDAGNSSQPMSEQQWNAMDPNSQYAAVSVASNGPGEDDPLVKDIMGRYNAAGNQGQGVMANQYNKFNGGPVWTDPVTGIKMTDQHNVFQSKDRITPLTGIATVLTAGMLGNAFLANGALGGAGAAGATEGAGGLLGASPYAGVDLSGLQATAPTFGHSIGGGLASQGSLGGLLGAAGGAVGATEASPYAGVNLDGLQGAAPTSGHSIGGGLASPSALGGGSSSGLLGRLMGGDISGAASGVGNWAMSNPLQAIGLLQAGSGLIGGGNKPSGGGSYTPQSTTQGNKGGGYTPNAYTMNQLRQYQRGMGL